MDELNQYNNRSKERNTYGSSNAATNLKLLYYAWSTRHERFRAPLNELASTSLMIKGGPPPFLHASPRRRFSLQLFSRRWRKFSTDRAGPSVSRGEQARRRCRSKQGEQQEERDQREARRPRQTPDLVAVRQLDLDLGHLEDGQQRVRVDLVVLVVYLVAEILQHREALLLSNVKNLLATWCVELWHGGGDITRERRGIDSRWNKDSRLYRIEPIKQWKFDRKLNLLNRYIDAWWICWTRKESGGILFVRVEFTYRNIILNTKIGGTLEEYSRNTSAITVMI